MSGRHLIDCKQINCNYMIVMQLVIEFTKKNACVVCFNIFKFVHVAVL